jgi:hypothetical protein
LRDRNSKLGKEKRPLWLTAKTLTWTGAACLASARDEAAPLQGAKAAAIAELLRLLGAGLVLLRRRFGNASAFFGRQQRYENVAFHARHGFNLALVANFHQQAIHLGAPDFLVGHFASAMKNHGADFVAFAEEPKDLILANLIVVFRSGGTKFDFFQLGATAALTLLVSFFVSLVKILAVVRDFANRRIGGGRNLHQIQSSFLGHLHGLERLHDPELAALIVDHPDFASADSLVDANAVRLPEAAFCDKSPSKR